MKRKRDKGLMQGDNVYLRFVCDDGRMESIEIADEIDKA